MNLNKIFAVIMAVCVMGMGVPYVNAVTENKSVITAGAVDYTKGTYGQLTYKNYGDYIEISGCDESATDVIIPAEIDGVPVTSIGKNAFFISYFRKNMLKSVEIPDSVTRIGDWAFSNCENLKSINIPAGVKNIGISAFEYCSSLESIEIPDGITIIEYGTFQSCESLTSIKITDSVTNIKVNAFEGCTGLTSIEIPDSVTNIESFAFSHCNSLKSVEISDSVTSIGGMVFRSSPWLEEKQKENPLVIINDILIDGTTCSGDVIIPDSVTSITEHAFDYCEDLKSVKIPDGITRIEDMTFYNCHNLTSVEIPDTVTSIGERAFEACTSLTSIKIPDSVTSLANYVFVNCSSLTSIEIPESVTSLGESVFYQTAWLDEKRKENPLVIVNNFLVDGKTCTGDVVIPDGVTNIIGMSFRENSNLTSIEIPESVKIIGTYVFEDCSNLKKVTILNPECDIMYNFPDIISETATIYGYENSTAQAYAEVNQRKFVVIGKEPEKNTGSGDMNGDGKVNIADALFLQQFVLGNLVLTPEQYKNADINGDGYVDSFDMVLIRRMIIENK